MTILRYARHRSYERYSHYLFRFPAKFHPPVLRKLLELYSKEDDLLLDPFCGSGTLLVESLLKNRNAIGVDVDPLAVFISRAKARPISRGRLETAFEAIRKQYKPVRRRESTYDSLIHDDFDNAAVERFRERLAIPSIPNIGHWFRNYVTIDLAQLKRSIMSAAIEQDQRRFFLTCFASIIRNASNADPVPVSGLEVTSHMKELEKAGRRIDPFALFEDKARREIEGMAALWRDASASRILVRRGDATRLGEFVKAGSIDLILTSPPYNTAVDYYRRHTLEMYWLDLVSSHEERLKIAPRYLGRAGIRVSSSRLRTTIDDSYLARLLDHAAHLSPARARALKHYANSMHKVLLGARSVLRPGGQAVIVVGNAKWNGRNVRATRLIERLAKNSFTVVAKTSYKTRDRYMSYSRRNGANISREYVIVLKRRG